MNFVLKKMCTFAEKVFYLLNSRIIMKKRIIIFGFFILFISQIQAHRGDTITTTTPRWRVGIEAGVNLLFDAKINKPPQIRENQSYNYSDRYDTTYDNDYYGGFVSNYQSPCIFYAGIKAEYTLSRRFAVSTGARFSYKKATLNSDKDYFLWRINENQTSTNYVRIKSITQRNYYLGVPLEIRFFPAEKDYTVRQYFILGTALNFLVASTNEVVFANPAMEKHSSEVLSQIKEPNLFYGLFYIGIGLKIGKMNHPFGNIEFHFPIATYGNTKSDAFSIIEGTAGIAFRTTLYIPIAKEHQLIYSVID
jgi:hypothetical protein